MKKPLLFSLFVWILLFVLPATRAQTRLDWRSATLEPLRDYTNASWAPLDAPYQPEQEAYFSYYGGMAYGRSTDALSDEFDDAGFRVAAPFAALLESQDRDVLAWCARSTDNPTSMARNFEILRTRFPRDAAMLAWTCGAQMNRLSLSTRIPGPMSAPTPNWSVKSKGAGSLRVDVSSATKTNWDALALRARLGQQLEPRNGFWWWLEAASLIGARRDERVWNVLRVGKTKPVYDDHALDLQLALRRAHQQVLGKVPMSFYLDENWAQWPFAGRWYEVTRQICENVMGARFAGRHKTALEGGRDLMMMGRVMRRSDDGFGYSLAIEQLALQNALPRSAMVFKRIPSGASAKVLAGAPTSLLRYANEQKRSDIALQIINEWNDVSKARRALTAKYKASLAAGTSKVEGVPDSLVALAAGTQNIGALLVQTLPFTFLWLGLLSVLSLTFKRRTEIFVVPSWTRGLGWSAFALLTLLGAQLYFAQLTWNYMMTMTGVPTTYWGFDFILPRLAALLPTWAWAFPVAVIFVGARWATLVASRRFVGKTPISARLRSILGESDDRTGALDLGPVLELIAVFALWGAAVLALGAWFYFPVQDPRALSGSHNAFDDSAGFELVIFALAAIAPTYFLRPKQLKPRDYWSGRRETMRRFLSAHIALVTMLYLLLSISGAFWSARFETQWLLTHAPRISAR